ncbi:MAG: RNA methyltransferase [Burkholderiaceae bacterium]
MKRISSRDNPSFKTLRLWSVDTAARRTARIAILEGIHLADAWLASGGMAREIVTGQSALDHPEVVDLLARAARCEPPPVHYALDDALFASLSQLAQGVRLLTIVDRPTPSAPLRIVRDSVVLDRVQDPGNVGSILRSAAAAGIVDVYLSRECAGGWSTKVLRGGMGAHFHLRIFEDCDLTALKNRADVPWIATSPHADASLYDADLRGDVAWVFGHEGQGLDAAFVDVASTVRIPQPGHGESLNVAASAAICFFEQVRQRKGRQSGS